MTMQVITLVKRPRARGKRDACSRIPMSGDPKGAKNCDSKFTLHLPSRVLPEAEGHFCHAEKTERQKGRKAERHQGIKAKPKERKGWG